MASVASKSESHKRVISEGSVDMSDNENGCERLEEEEGTTETKQQPRLLPV